MNDHSTCLSKKGGAPTAFTEWSFIKQDNAAALGFSPLDCQLGREAEGWEKNLWQGLGELLVCPWVACVRAGVGECWIPEPNHRDIL